MSLVEFEPPARGPAAGGLRRGMLLRVSVAVVLPVEVGAVAAADPVDQGLPGELPLAADLARGDALRVQHLVEGLDAHPQEARGLLDVQDLLRFGHASTSSPFQRASIVIWIQRAISSVGVPGPKSLAKPPDSSSAMSSRGMMPPPVRST